MSGQAPLTVDIVPAEPEQPETPPIVRQLVTQQDSRNMSSKEPRVEEVQTPSLIDQTLSMVEQSLHQLAASQENVSAPRVQEQRTASLISQTLAMVAVAISESTVSHAPPSLQPPVSNRPSKDIVLTKPQVQGEQTVIAQELSMVTGVAASEPESTKLASPSSVQDTAKAGEAISLSSQEFHAKTLTPEERLDIERANMRKRVETFKANQERFKRQREEYYEATMAKIRVSLRPSP